MLRNSASKAPTPLPLTGSQRQQRYRAAQKLCSIDVSRATLAALEALRARTGLSTDKVIAAALERLIAHLDDAGAARADLSTETAPPLEPAPASPGVFPDKRTNRSRTKKSPGDNISTHRAQPIFIGFGLDPNRKGGEWRVVGRKPEVTQYQLGFDLDPEDNLVNSDTSD